MYIVLDCAGIRVQIFFHFRPDGCACPLGYRGNECQNYDPCAGRNCGLDADRGVCVTRNTPEQGCEQNRTFSDYELTTLTASTNYNGLPPSQGVLGSSSSWSAASNNDQEWIQADFGRVVVVEAISTQGRENYNQWVTSYHVSTSLDGVEWNFIIDPLDHYEG